MNYSPKQKTLHKIAFILSCILFISLAPSVTKAQQTNFSGTWLRDTVKTSLGDGLSINSVPVSINVNQSEKGISITRNSVNRNGDKHAYTENLRADGSPAQAQVNPQLKKTSVIKWSADHEGFTDTGDYTDENGSRVQQNTEHWSLSGDGKTLTIHVVIDLGDQKFTAEEVFDKQ